MKTLKLFNAVIAKKPERARKPTISDEHGYLIEPNALWAEDRINAFYRKEALSGNDLNKTFHKSWQTIRDTPRGELRIQQILHYLSTYGTDFQGDVYIPDEVVKVPGIKIVFKVIKAYTKDQLIAKCLGLLQSGVALKEETVDDILQALVDELSYSFTGKENIRNKEAVVKIADLYGVIPDDFMGFFRYILFRSTGSALVIKNPATVAAIKVSTYDPTLQFIKFGTERLAENFNRFKPLFLAYKTKCPKVINEISRLSKKHHAPMVQNPLNLVTQRGLTVGDKHWLDNATPYAIFKALSALYQRMGGQSTFLYKVRNGKSYVKEDGARIPKAAFANYDFLLNYLKKRINLKGVSIYVPEDVVYALPTSEKMYVGNIPMGTKFFGSALAVGIYWEDAWGARDLDLSGLSAEGKTGWNASYGRGGSDRDGLMYSGDITNAPDGAVEYLYAKRGLPGSTLVLNNVFNGNDDAGFKIIIGRGDRIDHDFMMNPNNLFAEAKVQSIQKQSIIGLLRPEGKLISFVLLNLGAGHTQVSGYSDTSTLARVALAQEWHCPLSFNDVVQDLGAEIVNDPEDADFDLSLNRLEKDSFMKVFEGVKAKTGKRRLAAKKSR
jgi:hypothetical protein